jgi:hypothetical protein
MPENQNEKYKVWWDEKNEVRRLRINSFIDEGNAKMIMDEAYKLAESKPESASILVDLRESSSTSLKARKIFVEGLRTVYYSKCAFFGMKVYPRVVLSFIVKVSGAKNTKFFKSEEEALKWLKE